MRVLTIVGIVLFAAVGGLYFFQEKLMYFPSRYETGLPESYRKSFTPYVAADGKSEWGCLIEPRAGGPGEGVLPLYLVFGGNGSTAWGLAPYFRQLAERTGCGFYLVDYRGYGLNDGKPNEAGLTADALGAYDTMAAEGRFARGAGVIGISLGGGAAYAVAERRKVDRLITLSTFTSMDDMARVQFFWPLNYLCRNHWPNERRLKAIAARPPAERPREVILFHGDRDELIPFRMGGELAAAAPGYAQFVPVSGSGHNEILDYTFEQLVGILREPPKGN